MEMEMGICLGMLRCWIESMLPSLPPTPFPRRRTLKATRESASWARRQRSGAIVDEENHGLGRGRFSFFRQSFDGSLPFAFPELT
jgi:hypothetical protein